MINGIHRLAIDVGNVISLKDTDDGDSNQKNQTENDLTLSLPMSLDIADQLNALHPTLECTETCRQLVSLFGTDNTFILSKCKTKIQHATVRFLSNPIPELENQSFLEYTQISPRNVLFCTQKCGGIEYIPVKFKPLLCDQNGNGPRVAINPVGKGAIASTLGLTHLIDDRIECLLSFFWEGQLWKEYSKFLATESKHAPCKNANQTRRKKKKKQYKQEEPNSIELHGGKLLHFTASGTKDIISRGRVEQARNKMVLGIDTDSQRVSTEQGIEFCINQCWVPKHNWSQVCEEFGLG